MAGLTAQGHALLRWHLEHNHHPPVPRPLHRFAAKAIEMQGADEEVICNQTMAMIDSNGRAVTARQVCDAYHLWDFVRQVQADTELELGLTGADANELRQIEKEVTGE